MLWLPPKHPASALIHRMQFKFSKVVQWGHYSEILLCLTTCSQPADHSELRMFVVIGHNSVQREIRACTFNTNYQMIHRPPAPENAVVVALLWLLFSIIVWCWEILEDAKVIGAVAGPVLVFSKLQKVLWCSMERGGHPAGSSCISCIFAPEIYEAEGFSQYTSLNLHIDIFSTRWNLSRLYGSTTSQTNKEF